MIPHPRTARKARHLHKPLKGPPGDRHGLSGVAQSEPYRELLTRLSRALAMPEGTHVELRRRRHLKPKNTLDKYFGQWRKRKAPFFMSASE
jgi:hypothetical protein